MDAVEFLKIYKRMCENNSRFLQIDLSRADFESMVGDTEQWAKDHPVKTRQSEFLKMFPNALKDKNGILHLVPCILDAKYKPSSCIGTCSVCRENYWLQVVE